jgi:hypothetical protein
VAIAGGCTGEADQTWFEELTGFVESDGSVVPDRFREDGEYLESTVNGRRMRRGTFALASVAELRRRRDDVRGEGPTTIGDVVANVQDLHVAPAAAGATFQVASQFNTRSHPRPHPRRGPVPGSCEYRTCRCAAVRLLSAVVFML